MVKTDDEIKKMPASLRDYYLQQNRLLRAFDRINQNLPPEEENGDASSSFWISFLMRISFLSNILLFSLKVWTSISSGSLSVLGSTIESLLDLLSSFILWLARHAVESKDKYLYPVGKERMELLGVLVFATVMGTSSFQLVLFCVQVLAEGKNEKLELTLQAEIILVVTILVKFVLWILCRSVTSSSVQAYSTDHRNDVITNAIGTVCAYIGSNYFWFVDPLGAIAFSLYIIIDYYFLGRSLIQSLVGRTADPVFLQMVTYAAGCHDTEHIKYVDTVRAYSFGERYIVEVDVVMARDTPLHISHDVSEGLQIRLEQWPTIHRCLVHVDYEFTHKPEHPGP